MQMSQDEICRAIALSFNTVQYSASQLTSFAPRHTLFHSLVTIECQADSICGLLDLVEEFDEPIRDALQIP